MMHLLLGSVLGTCHTSHVLTICYEARILDMLSMQIMQMQIFIAHWSVMLCVKQALIETNLTIVALAFMLDCYCTFCPGVILNIFKEPIKKVL